MSCWAAIGDRREAVIDAIFWLKTRAHWKETRVSEIAGVPGKPLEQVTAVRRIIVSPPDQEKLKRERDERVRPHIEAERHEGDVVIWEQPKV